MSDPAATDAILQRMQTAERSRLLWLLCQIINELTVHARAYYLRSGPVDPMQEINEAIHYVSGHCRDLTDQDEPLTASRAASLGEALKMLTPAAADRLARRG